MHVELGGIQADQQSVEYLVGLELLNSKSAVRKGKAPLIEAVS